jgi:azurin
MSSKKTSPGDRMTRVSSRAARPDVKTRGYAVAWALLCGAAILGAQAPSAPKILLDASPRAIEYQLGRLTNAELTQVERKQDVRYRLVYYALLTRKGLGREYFDEALAALTEMEKATRTRVLLDALPGIPPEDVETGGKLLGSLLGQPAAVLRQERDIFAKAAEAGSGFVLQGAYGGMMLADGKPEQAWQLSAKRAGHLAELLRSVPYLGAATDLRNSLFDPVAALAVDTGDAATRVAALSALGWTRPDAAAFRLLAREFLSATDPEIRAAAVRSLQRVPKEAWPSGEVEPLARAIVAMVGKTTPDQRTDPSALEAIQLGEKLAAGLDAEARRAVGRDLRDLGVQVVRIETIPEQMAFDRKWFAVQAGKPVQVVLVNPDAMSHNLLITRPGSLKEVGMAATAMTLPSDPKVKPYVPETPLVLHATRLLNWGETDRLSFTAPTEAGEYPFVCTFPGHWVRMYGVMLVVQDFEAWEAKPTVPIDPMTNQPFPSER